MEVTVVYITSTCLKIHLTAFISYLQKRNKKGRKVVTREIDFDDDKEGLTSPTDELLTGPSTTTASECYNMIKTNKQTNENSYKCTTMNFVDEISLREYSVSNRVAQV